MAITQRTTIDPNAMTTAWSAGVSAAGAKWIKGIQSPRHLPNANPQANATNWLAGVQNAQPAYVAGISSPAYLTNLEAGAVAKQGSYTGSGAARKANAQAAFSKVAAMIQTALQNLPAKGPAGTNTARATAFATAMHALKGQGKARA